MTRQLLIVDDDVVFLKILMKALAPYHDECHVLMATNGLEATQILSTKPIDAVVTDLNMPKMNGFELLAYLQRNRPTLPVMVLTNYDTSPIEQRMVGFSSLTFLQKPVTPQVIATIRSRLQPPAKGYIEGITLISFLQLLNLEQKTCVLIVRSHNRSGMLYCDRGDLVHAIYNGQVGQEAAYEILGWDDVQIDIGDQPLPGPPTVQAPLSHILMEAVRLKDERNTPAEQ